jgi:hypothetical protein
MNALETGLTPTWEAKAMATLGEIQLARGSLKKGVDWLVRCLASRPIGRDAAHRSALHLATLYETAGRNREAADLVRVSATARPGEALDSSSRDALRELVRTTGAR